MMCIKYNCECDGCMDCRKDYYETQEEECNEDEEDDEV